MTPEPRNLARRPSSRPPGPSEVAPGLFVGDWKDARAFGGTRFCVLDEAPTHLPAGTHIPIIRKDTGRPDRRNLDHLASEILRARRRGEDVLVYCGHGVRRSPLAIAWFLHVDQGVSLEAAYDRIQAVRPQVERPQDWLAGVDELDTS